MPAHDESSAASRRQSWSARFSADDAVLIERGAALTHCGVSSRFVERAFLDYAAKEGALAVNTPDPPQVVAWAKKLTLQNIIIMQDALVHRLVRPAKRGGPSPLIARQHTINWLAQYLATGAAANVEPLPKTPLSGRLPSPLNLKMLPHHLEMLSAMAGSEGTKIDVLSAAIRYQAKNLGLEDDDYEDEDGLPKVWTRYPHPELLLATNTIEDTLLALIKAYKAMQPMKRTMESATSAMALAQHLPLIKLSKMVDD